MGKFHQGCVEHLILHVRHRAWLNARPGKGQDRPSRAEKFLADELKGERRLGLILPPLDAAEHLAEYLFRIGPTSAGEPVTFQEIEAWARLTGHDLNGWEAETLRTLSAAYASEHYLAEDIQRPAPFMPVQRVVPPSEAASRLLAMYQKLAAEHERGGQPKP